MIDGVVSERKIPWEEVVNVPKIVSGSKLVSDISQIDWEQRVDIGGNSTKLSSDEALDTLSLPQEVRDLVRLYRRDIDAIDGTLFMLPSTKADKKKHITEGLQYGIAKYLISKDKLPSDYFDQKLRGYIGESGNFVDLTQTPSLQLDPA